MAIELTPEEQKKQEYYRDARFEEYYDNIWQTTGKCVFCDLREKYVLFEQDGMVLAITLYAYIDGDMMIIPRRHVTATSDLTSKEWEATRKLMYIARKLIREVHGIRGVQFIQRHGGIQAQSTVEHLHIKCIPFDAPDLAVWNYRKLKHTPLENTTLYKRLGKKIVEHDLKFAKKHSHPSELSIVCDSIILNKRDEILFTERPPKYKLIPDIITLPGGVVTNFDRSLEEEIAREVREETGLALKPERFQLCASRITQVERTRQEHHLNVTYGMVHRFVLNTYVYMDSLSDIKGMRPGDDCNELFWLPRAEVAAHPRITEEIKRAISSLPL